MSNKLLQQKNAVIYGAGGSLGGAVAKALAAAGARVFLTGHKAESVEMVAKAICAAGGSAETAVVDGMNEEAVKAHIDQMQEKIGTVDISFNAVGVDVIQDMPLIQLAAADFVEPVTRMLHTRFITAKAAAQVMIKQQSGVILSLTATPGGIGYPYTGGFAPACCAIESLSRNLAAELGVYGIRVVNIRSGGSPDSRIFKEAIENYPEIMTTVLQGMNADTMLKRLPLMDHIAQTAVFLASNMAASITGVTIDVTAGTTAGLNYRSTRKV